MISVLLDGALAFAALHDVETAALPVFVQGGVLGDGADVPEVGDERLKGGVTYTVDEVVETIRVTPAEVRELCENSPTEAKNIKIVAKKRELMLNKFLEGVRRAGLDRVPAQVAEREFPTILAAAS